VILRVEGDPLGVELVEPERFDELKLSVPHGCGAAEAARVLGPGVDVNDDSHLRVPARAVALLAGAAPGWCDRFRAMLRAVEPMGWYDAATDTIRVHLEAQPSGRRRWTTWL